MADDEKPKLPKKPREYLEELEIGHDNGIQVPVEFVDTFRIAASRLRMRGLKFKTKMIEGGIKLWRVK